ncbi:ABC transporter substrate-binding protein [Lutimaribacter sp. EGI FJ00015]|uniref:ABC transporter substrate-binding protein n=1 Tax=Lutimaribacter degradans TaxID=2945989 RepID=A0ACC5ZSM8_9RHOB|nr:ABC transporter substrate-binding protein [Lutimaribacter sp. EGI FJ00013]MCM2561287.1 ABC transporter substrate-binding protein [Lutimaribacter sp. EGI FJ00013]MCO0611762.1 ABC transporter substrate-binding protein [Lutimaribacter sp. EGI FJ00015]MCO0635116.1 ABC transporter substrate-binding protein [Lutimaribacter sp. EGI FJ00014]
MKRYLLGTALAASMPMAAAAAEDCGEISIAEMNWASAQIVVAVSDFLLTQGYSCDVTVVPSDTTPAVTSLSENNEPDVVPEMWPNSAGDAYEKLKENGRIVELTSVLNPGGVEGWWIPTYLVEEHPELATIDGILENPELVGSMFNNCPDGWGCRIVSDNLARAYDLEGNGIEVFNHGSGETLATSMASAYESEEPWFGYYWGPTTPLGKFDMTSVDLGEYDEAAHSANQNADNPDPQPSAFPIAPILTVMTKDYHDSHPEIADFFSNVSFTTDEMSQLLAWQDANNASTEEAAVYYLQNNTDTWSEWLNDDARANLSNLLEQ